MIFYANENFKKKVKVATLISEQIYLEIRNIA